MNKYFDEIKNTLGFGCMRLPMCGEEVDIEHFKKMVDMYIENGGNYFDTAHGYIGGRSEKAIKLGLTDRYTRERYLLADKLSDSFFEKEEDIRPFFQSQLDICGVDYFDFYLMHCQTSGNYEKYKKCRAYETAFELKKEGKIRHIGFSFHDKADFLDKIITENPDIEFVQIQFNYLDIENPDVESAKCYEVCRKHNKPIIVMEPVKGGALAVIPKEADDILRQSCDGSNASIAIRFAAGYEGIATVLSGMSNIEQMADNLSFMKDFKPLNEKELTAVNKVRGILKRKQLIQCTGCRYCVDGCPKNIQIPDLFTALNSKWNLEEEKASEQYRNATEKGGLPTDCIKCGKCEKACPQWISIRKKLEIITKEF